MMTNIMLTHSYRQNDPKNKTPGKEEEVVNAQDDGGYDEDETRDTPKAPQTRENTNKEFEYSESGEFDNQTHLTDTNSNDEFL